MTDRLFRIWLSAKEAMDVRSIALLLERFGDPAHIYAAERAEFSQCDFLKSEQIDALCQKDLNRAEHILQTCEKQHITVLTPEDCAYPTRLKLTEDPPAVLYVRGQLPDLNRAPGIAIVGTRGATPYGRTQARKFGAALAAAGFTVVTGMAYGVDSNANQGALSVNRPTVAVLAGGVDICYPPKNSRLMGDILIDGAVISENPPGTDSRGFRFPIRNRIISGMCVATLIVEAPRNSGALITANTALEQGREVFVIPGNIDNKKAEGGNRLLLENAASIVLEPMDMIHALAGVLGTMPDEKRIRQIYKQTCCSTQTDEPAAPFSPQKAVEEWKKEEKRRSKDLYTPTIAELEARPKPKLEDISGDERIVAEAIRKGASTPDEIIRTTNLSAGRALSALTLLEIDGLVKGSSNGIWLVP